MTSRVSFILLYCLSLALAGDSVYTINPSGQVVFTSNLNVSSITTAGASTRFGLSAGTAPTSTVIGSKTYDAVIYVDADGKVKILLRTGSITVLTP